VTSVEDVVEDRPFFLTSSVFEHKAYGKCLTTLKKRMQLDEGPSPTTDLGHDHHRHHHHRGARGDMRLLVNVTMSPWTTDSDFLGDMVKSFRDIANEEMARCVKRNRLTPDIHRFIMQGFKHIHLVHIPMFHMANRRWQLIVTAHYPENILREYKQLRAENPDQFYTTSNVAPAKLEDLLAGADIEYRMDEGIPAPGTEPLAKFKLTNLRVVVKESTAYADLNDEYPDRMPFYLYGSRAEAHMDHVLRTVPNAQISVDCVKLNFELTDKQLASGVVAVLDDVFERSMQPLYVLFHYHYVHFF
jgi:hypothetical protein